MSNEYRAISELNLFEGTINGSEKLIISRFVDGNESNVVSYSTSIASLADCLSGIISAAMKDAITAGYKNLVSADKDDLEYNSRTQNYYLLTSFSHRRLGQEQYEYLSSNWCVMSALYLNDNHEIVKADYMDMHDVTLSAHNDMVDYLASLHLDKGILLTSLVGNKGIPLALIAGKNGNLTIYSGDASKLVTVTPTTNDGDTIAQINFAGTSNVAVIKNGLVVTPINPSYNTSNGLAGETICQINGVEVRNNVSIDPVQDVGQNVLNINGQTVKNGVHLTSLDTTGKTIAVIKGATTILNNQVVEKDIQIHNGVTVTDIPTNLLDKGRKICRIADTDIYNYVNVDDVAGSGDVIANVNGQNIKNGIVITHNVDKHLTYINNAPILGGIKLGSVTQLTTKGDIVAKVETANSIVPIYNGINVEALKSDIVTRLEAEIAALRALHEADMAWIRNEFTKYMLLNSGNAVQTVYGPTTFSRTITGNITNADYAVRAQWS